MEIKATLTLTASPELLAALSGMFNGKVAGPAAKTSKTTAAAPSKTEDPAGEVTITEIRELATKLSKDQGKGDKVKALLTEYDCKAITAVPADQYQSFYTKLKAL